MGVSPGLISIVPKEELTPDVVGELVEYDPCTGIMTWRARDIHWFNEQGWNGGGHKGALRNQRSWNGKWAGKEVGSVRHGPTNDHLWTTILGVAYPVHHLAFFIMTGRWPIEVDHRDGNGLNNKWSNLREVTRSQNQQNRRAQRTHRGRPRRFKAVGIKLQTNMRFNARIGVNGKLIDLGTYDTYAEAVSARKAAERKYGFTRRHGTEL